MGIVIETIFYFESKTGITDFYENESYLWVQWDGI